MNIIVESLNSIRTTGTERDIDSLKLFISRECTNSINILLRGDKDGKTYPLVKISVPSLDKTNYLGYRLVPTSAIPVSQEYYLKVATIELEQTFTFSDEPRYLSDEHAPTYVIGRQIGAINTSIVAQDAHSQQLTFYMRKKYDGVSFVTADKVILFDYIPLDPADLEAEAANNGGIVPTFLSTEAIVVAEDVLPPNGQYGEWILLKWNLPYQATKQAGMVKFAISVIAKTGDERAYTWQTEPSAFYVLPNLALRKGSVIPTENSSPFSLLADRVDDIEDFLGNNTDQSPSNDKELIIGGGGADEYIEEESE